MSEVQKVRRSAPRPVTSGGPVAVVVIERREASPNPIAQPKAWRTWDPRVCVSQPHEASGDLPHFALFVHDRDLPRLWSKALPVLDQSEISWEAFAWETRGPITEVPRLNLRDGWKDFIAFPVHRGLDQLAFHGDPAAKSGRNRRPAESVSARCTWSDWVREVQRNGGNLVQALHDLNGGDTQLHPWGVTSQDRKLTSTRTMSVGNVEKKIGRELLWNPDAFDCFVDVTEEERRHDGRPGRSFNYILWFPSGSVGVRFMGGPVPPESLTDGRHVSYERLLALVERAAREDLPAIKPCEHANGTHPELGGRTPYEVRLIVGYC